MINKQLTRYAYISMETLSVKFMDEYFDVLGNICAHLFDISYLKLGQRFKHRSHNPRRTHDL